MYFLIFFMFRCEGNVSLLYRVQRCLPSYGDSESFRRYVCMYVCGIMVPTWDATIVVLGLGIGNGGK